VVDRSVSPSSKSVDVEDEDAIDGPKAVIHEVEKHRIYHRFTQTYLYLHQGVLEVRQGDDLGVELTIDRFVCPKVLQSFWSFRSSSSLGDVGEFMCESTERQLKVVSLSTIVDISKSLSFETDGRFFLPSFVVDVDATKADTKTFFFQSTRASNRFLAVDESRKLNMKPVKESCKQNDPDIQFELDCHENGTEELPTSDGTRDRTRNHGHCVQQSNH
jgi:hypothetical protein